ncbi:MAG: glycoside hydrolase [Nitrospirae bacterium GWC2_57_9]|nr:MAG: glycoside hydrolase [Nitrospirae bacterium GWC2_57_9]
MERSICIHGHFYQPPRENPWLEFVEVQDSAFPYHDWNERIMAECYAPNSASRLMDGDGCITDIVSNYEKISFNFGPTLLLWMEQEAPELHEAIRKADARSVGLRSGHGNAMAQVYNHMIMPLANARDKLTQVLWALQDFRYRFHRAPEGMWLSETAADVQTLDLLAEQGILFTVLAPRQAAKMRKAGTDRWEDVSGSRIDPTRAYKCALPSGRHITLFFYDGPISQAVAFEKLLDSGERFAHRLESGFSQDRKWNQLLHIATDGESYGHHHKFGDMALAYALHYIEEKKLARITNYGEYLAGNPPEYEVQIYDNSSWSCVHGVERWRSNCGCNSGGYPSWNQEWRKPLRESLDWLRDLIAPLFEAKAGEYLAEPWSTRNGYIDVILDRSDASLKAFFTKYGRRELTLSEQTMVLELLEMQRHAMLMYTSCGWFFDELSGIETVQVIFYAGRAVQLAEKLFGVEVEKSFKERLSKAKSNIPQWQDGGRIYEQIVKPVVVDLRKVAAHFAISSFISDYGDSSGIFSYQVRKEDFQGRQTGEAKAEVGRISVKSGITLDSADFSFAAIHLGGHVFNAGVRNFQGASVYEPMKQGFLEIFEKGDIAELIRYMDKEFGVESYSLLNLFRDEQRKILEIAFSRKAEEFEDAYRHLYEENKTLMGFMRDAGMPVPKGFMAAVEFNLVARIKKEFTKRDLDGGRIKDIVHDAGEWHVALDSGVEFMIRRKGERLIGRLKKTPYDNDLLMEFLAFLEILTAMPVEVNLWIMQNTYDEIAQHAYGDLLDKANRGGEPAKKWIEAFRRTGELLFFNIKAILAPYEKKEQAA